MPRRITYTQGQNIGRNGIVFVKEVEKTGTKRKGLFTCHCGSNFEAVIDSVKSGHTSSCGCKVKEILTIRNTKHGDYGSKLHATWLSMRQRCNDSKTIGWDNYGGRGITVCTDWDLDYTLFKNWAVENGYEEGLSLDRKDNNDGYFPENCRWVNRGVQAQNRRKFKNNTSGYKGVSQDKSSGKFSCKLRNNGKNIFLGFYACAKEAALVYDKYILDNNLEHTTNFTYSEIT